MQREINPTPPTLILLFLETNNTVVRLVSTTSEDISSCVEEDVYVSSVVDVLRRSLFVHVHVCYIVRHFDSWLGRNIFSAAFGHVPAKLSPETHPWVQIDSMIAQEPV